MSEFLKALKLRARNYAFWVSLIALVPILSQCLGITNLPDDYANTLNSVLALLVAAGVVNNPTTSTKGFLDDSSEC